MIDCHTHTKYSADGVNCAEEIISAAAEKGLEYIAITDHVDIGYPKRYGFNEGVPDLAAYKASLWPLKEKYSRKIYVAIGAEIGWTPENQGRNTEMLRGSRLEYIINSVHAAGTADPYYPDYFHGRDKRAAYKQYLKCVLDSLYAPYRFHAVAHIGYVGRNAPYADKTMKCGEYGDIIDEILQKIIRAGRIVEINTHVYNLRCPTMPGADILKRYRELGGEYVTFASDAHSADKLLRGYGQAVETAEQCGFKEWTVIKNGRKTTAPF